jgi:hypothetical protein
MDRQHYCLKLKKCYAFGEKCGKWGGSNKNKQQRREATRTGISSIEEQTHASFDSHQSMYKTTTNKNKVSKRKPLKEIIGVVKIY